MKRLTRSIVSLVSGDAAGRAIGFVITVYLARTLSPAGFGVFGIGLAVLGHLQLIANPGIQLVETRNIAAESGSISVRIGGVLAVRIAIATVLALLAGILLPHVVSSPELASCILLSLLSLFPMALFVDWVLQGKEDFIPLSAGRVAGYAAYAVGVFVLIRSSADVLYAPTAFFIGNMVTALALLAGLAMRYGVPSVVWSPALWRSILVANAPTGAAMYFGQMVFNLPPLVVGYFLGTHDAGLYSAATKLIFLLLMGDRVLNAVLLPALTRLLTERPDEVPRVLTLLVKLIWLVGIPVALCGVLLAPGAIELVFGGVYERAAAVTQVLFLYVGLTLLNSIAVCTIVATKNEGAYARRMIAGSAVLAIAVIVLTPFFGVVGAAVGATVGEGVTLVLMAKQAVSLQPLVRSGLTWRSMVVLLPVLLTGWIVRPLPVGAAVVVVLGVWGILMVLTRVVDTNDRARLRAFLL
jgi:O-antigen/teichoic acid export membrane protein